MTPKPPEATSDKLCFKCAEVTTQQLVRSDKGCDWKCTKCNYQLFAFTLKDMAEILQKHFFKIPDHPKAIDIPADFKVFLKCDLPEAIAAEMEVNPESVRSHVRVTGQLPTVGKPLFAYVEGLPVPFGEVARIQGITL